MNKKNLIIGAATGYTYKQLFPFIKTLKETQYNGDICFLISYNTPNDLVKKLKEDGIVTIKVQNYLNHLPKILHNRFYSRFMKPIHKIYPYVINFLPISQNDKIKLIGKISTLFLSIACSRYYYYYKYINNNRKHNRILLTDVRDVVFQRNPFEIQQPEGIYLAIENTEIMLKNDSSNTRWIKNMYGKSELNKIGDAHVSCSGTTMGDENNIINYLKKMIIELSKVNYKIAGRFGYDQGVHNYLLRNNNFKNVNFMYNGESPVYTMLLTKNFNIKDGTLYNNDNTITPLLHQYDWHPELNLKVLKSI